MERTQGLLTTVCNFQQAPCICFCLTTESSSPYDHSQRLLRQRAQRFKLETDTLRLRENDWERKWHSYCKQRTCKKATHSLPIKWAEKSPSLPEWPDWLYPCWFKCKPLLKRGKHVIAMITLLFAFILSVVNTSGNIGLKARVMPST